MRRRKVNVTVVSANDDYLSRLSFRGKVVSLILMIICPVVGWVYNVLKRLDKWFERRLWVVHVLKATGEDCCYMCPTRGQARAKMRQLKRLGFVERSFVQVPEVRGAILYGIHTEHGPDEIGCMQLIPQPHVCARRIVRPRWLDGGVS